MLGFAPLAGMPLAGDIFQATFIPGIETLTDTTILQKPINCVLAGQQEYEQGGYDIEEVAPNYNADVKFAYGGGGRISGTDPVFTTKTGNKGYD